MAQSHVHFEWQPSVAWRAFRTGVSLHSHTAHSRESLDFVLRLKAQYRWLCRLLDPLEARYHAFHGEPLDYARVWWTPPLSAREALSVEEGQIVSRLEKQPLVSITDHDNIDAPLTLRVLPQKRHTPVSVEWTVPYGGTMFHLGIHNLPPRSARQRMEAMASYTAMPNETLLPGLLEWLAEEEATLIVFNHPFWDERGVGSGTHRNLAAAFFRSYGGWIHAFELNGLRGWRENRAVLEWAAGMSRPAVSGGDRHTCEPNALTNVTNASTFTEFAQEIRAGVASQVLVMSQYRESMRARICAAVADAIRENLSHGHGWTRWKDRVFWQDSSGEVHSIAAFFDHGAPAAIDIFVAMCRLLDWRGVRTALRFMSPAAENLVL